MSHFQSVKKYLLENSFTHTNEWLTACVDWVTASFPNLTDQLAKEQVYQQWIDCNLEELASSCLPPNLATQKCTTLKGKFALQMNCIEDIGESAYSQWKQIKKLENENVNVTTADKVDTTWAPKPRRCLYMTMTDGKQTVYGLEMSSISALSLQLKPGTKMLLTGPIECRRGVLQLRPSNIRVIGGEVEGFLQSHSAGAMLCKRLNMPIDPNMPGTGALSQPQSNHVRTTAPVSSAMEVNDGFGDLDDDDDIFMNIDENALTAQATSSELPNSTNNNASTFDWAEADTELIVNTQGVNAMAETQRIPTQLIPSSHNSRGRGHDATVPTAKAEAKKQGQNTSRKKPSKDTQSIISSAAPKRGGNKETNNKSSKPKQMKIDGFMKPVPVIIKPKTPVRGEPQGSASVAPPQATNISKPAQNAGPMNSTIILESDDDEELMDLVDNMIEAEMNDNNTSSKSSSASSSSLSVGRSTGVVLPMVNNPNQWPICVPSNPFNYLKQIKEIKTGTNVRVKACISTISKSLAIEDGIWTLSVCINDGTGFLNCKVSSGLLNRIIGFDPVEMKRLKGMKTSAAKHQIAEGMNRLTAKLVHLNAVVELQIDNSNALITNFTDIYTSHLNAVKDRSSVLKKC